VPAEGTAGRRRGRGKLSTIEMLPEEADEHIAWADAQLREGKLTQTVILAEFNERLLDLGLTPISKGTFSRWSVRKAIELRKLDAGRRLVEAVTARLPPGERSDSMIAAAEMLKFRILDMVMSRDEPDPKLLNVAALALSRMSLTALREAQGQRLERKEQREEEERRSAGRKAGQEIAADGEAAEAAEPVDAEAVLRRIREDIYGIFGA
jgi:hypothetical protein